MTTTPCTMTFASRLDTEWDHLRRSRRALHTARTWAADEPDHPLGRLTARIDDLQSLIAATQRGARTDGDVDLILLRLIDIARDQDLAGRVLVQRLLPGLIGRTTAYDRYKWHVDGVEIVVPAAWLAIRSYDTQRRRHDVASSLLCDAIFQAFRRPLRRRSATETVRPITLFAERASCDEPATALEELAVVLREAQAAGVADHHLDLVRRLVQTGSSSIVAGERKVTPRTIRNHRDRAVEHIRRAVAVAA